MDVNLRLHSGTAKKANANVLKKSSVVVRRLKTWKYNK